MTVRLIYMIMAIDWFRICVSRHQLARRRASTGQRRPILRAVFFRPVIILFLRSNY